MCNKKIGVIYYKDELKLHNKIDYIEYNQVDSIENIKIKNKPTLIIGWDLLKTKYDNINILNKNINNLLFWTFSFKEKKTDYIHDLNKFIKINIVNIFKFYEYKILSPVFFSNLKNYKDYISLFNGINIDNIFIYKNGNISILSQRTIYRIDLKELKFFNIDIKEFINYLNKNYTNILFDRYGEIEKSNIEYFKYIDNNVISKYLILLTK